MDYYKTLTYAELQAIFAETHEEMQQIEQRMECPIEWTQRKCKKCARFFSDKAALKQHHCKLSIEKEKCLHRG